MAYSEVTSNSNLHVQKLVRPMLGHLDQLSSPRLSPPEVTASEASSMRQATASSSSQILPEAHLFLPLLTEIRARSAATATKSRETRVITPSTATETRATSPSTATQTRATSPSTTTQTQTKPPPIATESRATSPSTATQARATSPSTATQSRATPPYTATQTRATTPSTATQSRATPPYTATQTRATPPYTATQARVTSPSTATQTRATSPYTATQARATPPYTATQARATAPYTATQTRATPPYTATQTRATAPSTATQARATPPSTATQTRATAPSTATQTQATPPSTATQSRATPPSTATQARATSPSTATQSRATPPYTATQTQATPPFTATQSRATLPYTATQSRATAPSTATQSRATLPYTATQTRATAPSTATQTQATPPYTATQSRATLPYTATQSRATAPSTGTQTQATPPYTATQSRATAPYTATQIRTTPPSATTQTTANQSAIAAQTRTITFSTATQAREPPSAITTAEITTVEDFTMISSGGKNGLPSHALSSTTIDGKSSPQTANVTEKRSSFPALNLSSWHFSITPTWLLSSPTSQKLKTASECKFLPSLEGIFYSMSNCHFSQLACLCRTYMSLESSLLPRWTFERDLNGMAPVSQSTALRSQLSKRGKISKTLLFLVLFSTCLVISTANLDHRPMQTRDLVTRMIVTKEIRNADIPDSAVENKHGKGINNVPVGFLLSFWSALKSHDIQERVGFSKKYRSSSSSSSNKNNYNSVIQNKNDGNSYAYNNNEQGIFNDKTQTNKTNHTRHGVSSSLKSPLKLWKRGNYKLAYSKARERNRNNEYLDRSRKDQLNFSPERIGIDTLHPDSKFSHQKDNQQNYTRNRNNIPLSLDRLRKHLFTVVFGYRPQNNTANVSFNDTTLTAFSKISSDFKKNFNTKDKPAFFSLSGDHVRKAASRLKEYDTVADHIHGDPEILMQGAHNIPKALDRTSNAYIFVVSKEKEKNFRTPTATPNGSVDLPSKRWRRKHRGRFLFNHLRRRIRSLGRKNRALPTSQTSFLRRGRAISAHADSLSGRGIGRGLSKASTNYGSVEKDGNSKVEGRVTVSSRLPQGVTQEDALKTATLEYIKRSMGTRKHCSPSDAPRDVPMRITPAQVFPHFKTEIAKTVDLANHISDLLSMSRTGWSRESLLDQFFAMTESILEVGPKVLGCAILYNIPEPNGDGGNTSNTTRMSGASNNKYNSSSPRGTQDSSGSTSSSPPYLYPYSYRYKGTGNDGSYSNNNNNNNVSTVVMTDLSTQYDPRKMPWVVHHARIADTSRLLRPRHVIFAEQDYSGELDTKSRWDHVIRVTTSDGFWGRPYYECLLKKMVIQYSVPFYRLGKTGAPIFQ
ncbi:absent in melanoma 1b [Plakobranchus ocellatus]|uniref:Absent in melanoma 1b n=1 Tax=Plakobranchus ocellatus TaxID=259542 RepID=A0AAV3YIW2_9GAST|nr:absent in melanoma 1b [Plakobranchus ocellatus]